MFREQHGKLEKSSIVYGEQYNVYLPDALPPIPPVNMSEITELLGEASLAIGELNGVVEAVPDLAVINYMYVRKEAVLSSQIEGTQSTLDDLMRYEAGTTAGVFIDDVTEVSSYVAALSHGLKRINEGFPLSQRLIKEIHKILLTNSRGQHKTPGEFRRTQNWIGGSRPGNAHFVPPPPDRISDLISDLEKFIHDKNKIPPLVKAALIHQQFETIHPFLDGNGRTGRLLITLFLYAEGCLRSPFLYLSLFFKQHRDYYYEMLSEPRKTGDWEKWINFFLEGAAETAIDAKMTLIHIKNLFTADDEKVAGLGRARGSAELVFTIFKQKPILAVSEIMKRTGLSKPTVISSVKHLIKLGIIHNKSRKKWGQIYAYSGYTGLLLANG
ncbi:MAG: Fic family protein [Treponema sp.]|nr:Fic family protein [Treponema sp.]